MCGLRYHTVRYLSPPRHHTIATNTRKSDPFLSLSVPSPFLPLRVDYPGLSIAPLISQSPSFDALLPLAQWSGAILQKNYCGVSSNDTQPAAAPPCPAPTPLELADLPQTTPRQGNRKAQIRRLEQSDYDHEGADSGGWDFLTKAELGTKAARQAHDATKAHQSAQDVPPADQENRRFDGIH